MQVAFCQSDVAADTADTPEGTVLVSDSSSTAGRFFPLYNNPVAKARPFDCLLLLLCQTRLISPSAFTTNYKHQNRCDVILFLRKRCSRADVVWSHLVPRSMFTATRKKLRHWLGLDAYTTFFWHVVEWSRVRNSVASVNKTKKTNMILSTHVTFHRNEEPKSGIVLFPNPVSRWFDSYKQLSDISQTTHVHLKQRLDWTFYFPQWLNIITSDVAVVFSPRFMCSSCLSRSHRRLHAHDILQVLCACSVCPFHRLWHQST